MRLLTDLILKDAVEKSNPEGINQYTGSGSGAPEGTKSSDGLYSTKEKDIPKFVSSFLSSHSTGASAAAYLKTVDESKLRTALKLISENLDSSSGLVRSYVGAEMKRRGLK